MKHVSMVSDGLLVRLFSLLVLCCLRAAGRGVEPAPAGLQGPVVK